MWLYFSGRLTSPCPTNLPSPLTRFSSTFPFSTHIFKEGSLWAGKPCEIPYLPHNPTSVQEEAFALSVGMGTMDPEAARDNGMLPSESMQSFQSNATSRYERQALSKAFVAEGMPVTFMVSAAVYIPANMI